MNQGADFLLPGFGLAKQTQIPEQIISFELEVGETFYFAVISQAVDNHSVGYALLGAGFFGVLRTFAPHKQSDGGHQQQP